MKIYRILTSVSGARTYYDIGHSPKRSVYIWMIDARWVLHSELIGSPCSAIDHRTIFGDLWEESIVDGRYVPSTGLCSAMLAFYVILRNHGIGMSDDDIKRMAGSILRDSFGQGIQIKWFAS